MTVLAVTRADDEGDSPNYRLLPVLCLLQARCTFETGYLERDSSYKHAGVYSADP